MLDKQCLICYPHEIKIYYYYYYYYYIINLAGPDSAVSSVSRHAFGSSQVRCPGLTPFTSCEVPVSLVVSYW